MMTGFARILIVLGFLRRRIGTPSMPPTQILVGFSLFLTIFVMGPTFSQINERAVQPYLNQQIEAQQAIKRAEGPMNDVHAQADAAPASWRCSSSSRASRRPRRAPRSR